MLYVVSMQKGEKMNSIIVNVKTHSFGNITAQEKIMEWQGVKWRYTVSGHGDQFILAILSNMTGHLLGLPLAEEFRDTHKTIALSVPPTKSFSDTSEGLKQLLDFEKIDACHVIGHSNGGVYLQNLIAHHPEIVDKIVFSHSLTSMEKNDVFTTNASEIKTYKVMRKMLKVLPVTVLTFAMSRMVLSKLYLQSGQQDTKRLVALCKEDIKGLTKQDFITMADCMEDFLHNHTFTSEHYIKKPQDVLVVDSPTDKVVNPLQRAQMLKLCPGAREHHFEEGGHITLVKCRNEYFSLLRDFWL